MLIFIVKYIQYSKAHTTQRDWDERYFASRTGFRISFFILCLQSSFVPLHAIPTFILGFSPSVDLKNLNSCNPVKIRLSSCYSISQISLILLWQDHTSWTSQAKSEKKLYAFDEMIWAVSFFISSNLLSEQRGNFWDSLVM